MPFLRFLSLLIGALATVLSTGTAFADHSPRLQGTSERRPNILFIILDDIGIDQLAIFNPLAPTTAPTPTLDTLASAGLKFRNFYPMPECSPTRACFFTGRYPLRTGVTAAFLELDLPGAQVSRFEITTPKILSQAGYHNALIGKLHIAGPSNNPDGVGTPYALGWDYFNGGLHGAPAHIDPTLGGQYPEDSTTYPWGFPAGNQRGVGWFLQPDQSIACDDNNGLLYSGKEIVTLGGIPALDAEGRFANSCEAAQNSGRTVHFNGYNGYYAWPRVINDGANIQTSIGRKYAVIDQTDHAISWIRQQSATPDPWMCTVSYSAIHTPYQPPPDELYPPGFTWPHGIPETDASNPATTKVVSDLMVSAVDREIGRLLVETELATRGPDGGLQYDPAATGTIIVVAGDNGTFLSSVNAPYNPLRSKGTPYETGSRAPLLIAGPLVEQPGRDVDHLVSAVDLFELFGEIAGVDVRSVVPPSHVLDSLPMLAYLTNASQPSIRRTVFTQLGTGLKAPASHIWPAVLSLGPVNLATDILFTSQTVAESEGATWYGPGGEQVFFTACDLREAGLYSSLIIVPTRFWTLRNEQYKLIKLDRAPCDSDLGSFEFYDLTPTPNNPLNPLGLDNSDRNLLSNGVPVNLTIEQQAQFDELLGELNALLASEAPCYSDGNLDKRITQEDADGVLQYWGQASWFDVNKDGTTDQKDLDCVTANLGNDCLQSGPGTECPTPVYLNQPKALPSGGFQFLFTGAPGTDFQVSITTNLPGVSMPWTVLGQAEEASPGRFEFIDPVPRDARSFYRVHQP